MNELGDRERSLEETSTWAVAIVCFALVSISLLIEHALQAISKWLKKLQKAALVDALETVKTELMLMGFVSILLTLGQGPITNICISPRIAATWLPWDTLRKEASEVSKHRRRRLLEYVNVGEASKRVMAEAPIDKCSEKGQVAFVSEFGIHQLHYFIFVLAIFQIVYCIITYILGRSKMKKWRVWEEETKTMEYQEQIDPERFRVAKDTSFGRRHLQTWSRPFLSLWIVCFFRQFIGSVTKVDYRTLRHGFITAHLAPGSESRFDFQNYINRSLEDDFKEVVRISPMMWLIAMLFLLANTYGLHSYLWLPFIPLVIALLIGTKLQVIITQMGLRIQEKGEVIKGVLVVQPGDDLFWFRRPRLVLFLIHLILFQNAFQLAFFFWSWWKFGINESIHDHRDNFVIRITMGVLIQVLCSYVTLPLYALVSQMGSTYRPIIFNDRIVAALKNWHRAAKKRSRESRHSESLTQVSSATVTPPYVVSPAHPLCGSSAADSDSEEDSSRKSDVENGSAVISIYCNRLEEEGDEDFVQEETMVGVPSSEENAGEMAGGVHHEITIEEDE